MDANSNNWVFFPLIFDRITPPFRGGQDPPTPLKLVIFTIFRYFWRFFDIKKIDGLTKKGQKPTFSVDFALFGPFLGIFGGPYFYRKSTERGPQKGSKRAIFGRFYRKIKILIFLYFYRKSTGQKTVKMGGVCDPDG